MKRRKDFRSERAAEKAFERLRAKGIYDAGVVYDAMTGRYRLLWDDKKSNPGRPTKAQRAAKAKTAAAKRRVAVALAKFLKQANPAMKTAGASVQKLKGGVIKITPIRAKGRR